ncbi:membrane protein [Nitrospira sp. KM1]|nr:membrane protein [Nitrospira sp. KM1]
MRYAYGAFFVASGFNHFINLPFYVSIMPHYLPWHEVLVYISGVAEIVLGSGLWVPTSMNVSAWGLIALLVGVFPANVHMALHPGDYAWAPPLLLWLRLPLQALLIAWAYLYTRPSLLSGQISRPTAQ